MRLVSWNINGWRNILRRSFWEQVAKMGADILALQEIKAGREVMAELGQPPAGSGYHLYFHSAQRPGYSGVAVFSRREPEKVEQRLGHERFDREGRLLKLDFANFSFLALYMPNGQRDQRDIPYKLAVYQLLTEKIKIWRREKPVILAGDFNVARAAIDLARPQQNRHNTMFTPGERKALAALLRVGLVDTFRYLHPGRQQFSWWPYWRHCRERNLGWRIDYLLLDRRLQSQLKKAFIWPQYLGSDHCPVGVELELGT